MSIAVCDTTGAPLLELQLARHFGHPTSKGERRLTSRAGGEHRTHGEDAGPEDLVCARSAGGWRGGGGDASGFGDALISLRTRSKGLEEERYTMTRP